MIGDAKAGPTLLLAFKQSKPSKKQMEKKTESCFPRFQMAVLGCWSIWYVYVFNQVSTPLLLQLTLHLTLPPCPPLKCRIGLKGSSCLPSLRLNPLGRPLIFLQARPDNVPPRLLSSQSRARTSGDGSQPYLRPSSRYFLWCKLPRVISYILLEIFDSELTPWVVAQDDLYPERDGG